eukprot:Pgem_evm1s13438
MPCLACLEILLEKVWKRTQFTVVEINDFATLLLKLLDFVQIKDVKDVISEAHSNKLFGMLVQVLRNHDTV